MPKPKPPKNAGRIARSAGGDVRGSMGKAARSAWLWAMLVLAGLLVYANSFRGVMLFDDFDAIVVNSTIRRLWPVFDVLRPPAQSPMAGRPVVNLTFAINYAFGALQPWGYHAVNLAIHLTAGLLLWGVLRRVWPLAGRQSAAEGGAAGVAGAEGRTAWLATVAALIWMVHPLQTESVTYIVQRAEALVGLFYLLTLYGSVRGFQATGRAAGWWFVAAVAACALGMGTKENMATAPLTVFMLDWAFFSGSIRRAFRQRWPLYVGLAATLVVLAGLMAAGPRSNSAGFGIAGMSFRDYAASQPLVILHYLRLAIWPHPLCLDYGWPAVKAWPGLVLPVLVLAAAAVASLWALRRRSAAGFPGVWFFVVLAPTSSVVPLKDLAFEHRMYLPLAAVAVLGVCLGDRLVGRLSQRLAAPMARRTWINVLLVVVIVGALSCLTIRRNVDYQDAVRMWNDVLAQRPNNARAYVSLGSALGMAGRQTEALEAYGQALRLDPLLQAAQANAGRTLAKLGRYEEAVVEYGKALERDPSDIQVRYSLGIALEATGRFDEALERHREVLRVDRDNLLAQLGVGVCLHRKGDLPAAAEAYRRVLAGDAMNMEARCSLASCLVQIGRNDEAIAEYRNVLKMSPRHAPTWYGFGNALLAKGEAQEALHAYVSALSIDPGNADARCNMGVALKRLGRVDEAIACHRETVQRFPRHVTSRFNLANLLAEQGKYSDAAAEYSEVLKIEPGHAAARAALDGLSARTGTGRS
jgi:protein O-mannosyl-transferase